jgi:uncharacterized membrane protein YgcG
MSTTTVKQHREPTGLGAVLRARVDLWLVVALMAMSFGAGVIVKTLAEPPAAPAVSTSQGFGTLAPPLTDQQIQNGLPADHPDFTNGGSGSGSGQGTGQGTGGGQGGNGGGQGGN